MSTTIGTVARTVMTGIELIRTTTNPAGWGSLAGAIAPWLSDPTAKWGAVAIAIAIIWKQLGRDAEERQRAQQALRDYGNDLYSSKDYCNPLSDTVHGFSKVHDVGRNVATEMMRTSEGVLLYLVQSEIKIKEIFEQAAALFAQQTGPLTIDWDEISKATFGQVVVPVEVRNAVETFLSKFKNETVQEAATPYLQDNIRYEGFDLGQISIPTQD